MYIGSNNFIDVTFFNSASSHPGNNTIKSEWILFMNWILPCYAIARYLCILSDIILLNIILVATKNILAH